jgi:hypothetical protein
MADMGRAERFEDEKRRIIESCFSKKDDDGSSKPFSLAPPSMSPHALGASASRPSTTERLLTQTLILLTWQSSRPI